MAVPLSAPLVAGQRLVGLLCLVMPVGDSVVSSSIETARNRPLVVAPSTRDGCSLRSPQRGRGGARGGAIAPVKLSVLGPWAALRSAGLLALGLVGVEGWLANGGSGQAWKLGESAGGGGGCTAGRRTSVDGCGSCSREQVVGSIPTGGSQGRGPSGLPEGPLA